MTGPRIGSLFSGAGALDLAVESAVDGHTVWHAETDEAASQVLAAHWPGVPNLGDVTAVDWASVEPVDVMCGGFPCQDLSAAGRREGMRPGTRSGLWADFARAIATLRPSLVLIENVRGLGHVCAESDLEPCPGCVGDGKHRPVLRALGRVLGDLANLGFDAEWTGLSASQVGAPHGRFRYFVAAWPAGDADSAASRERWLTAARETTRGGHSPTLADQIEHLPLLGTPRASDGMQHPLRVDVGNPRGRLEDQISLLPTPIARDVKGANQRGDDTCLTGALLPTPRSHDAHGSMQAPAARQHVEDGNGSLPEVLGAYLFPTPRATDGTNGGPNRRGSSGDLMLPSAVHTLLPTPTATPYGNNQSPSAGAAIRPSINTLALTLLPTPGAIDAGDGPKLIRDDGRTVADHGPALRDIAAGMTSWGKYEPAIRHWERLTRPAPEPTEPAPKGGRRLSCRFDEWLMGWPSGWVTDLVEHRDALRICGNGVVPQQAAHAVLVLLPRTLGAAS